MGIRIGFACTSAALALAACQASQMQFEPALTAAPARPAPPPVRAAATLEGQEAQQIEALFAEAQRVLLLPAFARNLAVVAQEVDDLRVAPWGRRIAGEDLARLVQGGQPGFSYVAVPVRWLSGGTSTIGWDRALDAISIRLAPEVRTHWRSADARVRSCAVNSAAHELTHTITRTPPVLDYTIADRGFSFARHFGQHFASYTVGAVAQCTWLEEQGLLVEGLAACVRTYGTNRFRTDDCEQ